MKKIVFLLFLNSFSIFSQLSEKNALSWFDSVIGQENLEINSGEKYIEKYRALKGTYHFLFDDEINKAVIVYDGQTYFDIPLMYDVLDQNVIVKIASEIEDYLLILNKEKLNNFTVKNRSFFNIIGQGICEKLSSYNKNVLYKKHSAKKSEFYHYGHIYNKFSDRKNYIIYYKTKYYNFESKKDLKKIFPTKKKVINKFYSKNKTLLKSSKDIFIKNLIKKIVI